MVKRSKKSKSKRTPLRKKYKIIRKVKEHHKKKAKDAKRRGEGPGGKVRAEKDPGIPNAWPLKEQELAALEARRQRAIDDKDRQREERRLARAQTKAAAAGSGAAEADSVEMGRLLGDAGQRSREFEHRQGMLQEAEDAGEGQGRKRKGPEDGSRRAFYREVLKVVNAADVVIQVLDARDPLGCRCPELERLVIRGGAGSAPKKLILLLNKIDLVPREIVEKWLAYLREELPTVAFKCSTQAQRTNLASGRGRGGKLYGGLKAPENGTAAADDSAGSKCLGAETLIQLLKNYCRNQNIKTAISVGVVGLPNVGKSSLINSLKRARVASVGSTPGVTRALQEVHLDKHVRLLDSPGVVMTTSSEDNMAAAALRNAIKVEQLTDTLAPVRRIVQLCSKDALMAAYRISRFADVDEFVRTVAFARGRLKKGGVPDTTAAAKLILSDWNEGRIPFYTNPPTRPSADLAIEGEGGVGPTLVQQWGAEFDAEAVFRDESSAVIAGLAGLAEREEGVFAQLPASQPAEMDTGEGEEEGEGMDVLEEEEDEEEEEEEEDIAEEMEADAHEANGVEGQPEAGSRKAGKAKQNEALYTADGILNPHTARAEKKRRKKEKKLQSANPQPKHSAASSGALPMEAEDDYNFAEEYGDEQKATE